MAHTKRSIEVRGGGLLVEFVSPDERSNRIDHTMVHV